MIPRGLHSQTVLGQIIRIFNTSTSWQVYCCCEDVLWTRKQIENNLHIWL